jgi:hypothetical protein
MTSSALRSSQRHVGWGDSGGGVSSIATADGEMEGSRSLVMGAHAMEDRWPTGSAERPRGSAASEGAAASRQEICRRSKYHKPSRPSTSPVGLCPVGLFRGADRDPRVRRCLETGTPARVTPAEFLPTTSFLFERFFLTPKGSFIDIAFRYAPGDLCGYTRPRSRAILIFATRSMRSAATPGWDGLHAIFWVRIRRRPRRQEQRPGMSGNEETLHG